MIKKILLLSLIFMGTIYAANINTNKDIYTTTESIDVEFSNMEAQNEDWIAIYPAESTTDWENVIQWKWTEDIEEGNLNFETLPKGEYEVRAFYNNSYQIEASKQFRVTDDNASEGNTTLETDKRTYQNNEQITVTFANMMAKDKDWIGIYPKNSNNDWENVVAWNWTEDTTDGQLIFDALPNGEYEARAFYHNSFELEAKKDFNVTGDEPETTVTTDKESYLNNEQITINFANMIAKDKDWIGIYPKNSNNDWENVIAWNWTEDTTNGQLIFDALPNGEYEARAFYHNSFNLEAKKAFTVTNGEVGITTVTTNKTTYLYNEKMTINFANMEAKNEDWIGIYPKNSNNDWDNVIAWKWTGDTTNGQLTFNSFPKGEYEVRAFYNNGFELEAKKAFQVIDDTNNTNTIVFEDAENGIDDRWNHYAGEFPLTLEDEGAQGSAHSIRALPDMNGTHNLAGYYFPFENPDQEFKILNLDVRIGMSSHVGDFTLFVKTKDGNRRIVWAVYLNHPGNDFSGNAIPAAPFHANDNYVLMNPAPSDYYVIARNEHSSRFHHYKINVEETLQILEPDNEILSIIGFTTSGGDFDNIALSNN